MAAENQAQWQVGRVAETADVAEGIRRIVLEVPRPSRAAPGSHIDVVVEIAGRRHTRSYSVVSCSDDARTLAITVHLSPTSRGGSSFMHCLAAGDSLEMTQPLQNFSLSVTAGKYVLLAGGIGITPILGMSRTLQRRRADYEVVYVGRSRKDMAYLEEMVGLHGNRLTVHVDDEGTSLDVDRLVDRIAAEYTGSLEMYMCGPIRLMDAVRRRWQAHRLPLPSLRFETFGNSGWFDVEPFVVRIPRLGIETTVNTDQTMLQALEEAGADILFECRKGECGLCQVKVIAVKGSIDHRDVFFSDEQKSHSEHVCSCVSRVAGHGKAVLEIDVP